MQNIPNLFDFISYSGSMTLEELSIRSSLDDKSLSKTLSRLLLSGVVSLSDGALAEVVRGLRRDARQSPNGSTVEMKTTPALDAETNLAERLQAAIHDDAASEIVLIPTTAGYRAANT